MPEYLVTWRIDIEADSPEEAAARALIVQRDSDPANTATVFEVSYSSSNGRTVKETIDPLEDAQP